ncbi:MAG: hypothetical protein AB9897_01305 [Anaerolineaceae bacterium]
MGNKLTQADLWGVELWGPAVAALWRTIKDGKGKAMASYDFDQLPDVIKVVPCALNYLFPESSDISYNQAALNTAVWRGQTEFHLVLDNQKSSLSYIWQFYRLITKAAAASYTLNGLVEGFQLRPTKSLEVSILKYGDEVEHFGIIAYWEVYESISGKLTVGS